MRVSSSYEILLLNLISIINNSSIVNLKFHTFFSKVWQMLDLFIMNYERFNFAFI